jgi:hypothetical protein
MEARDDTATIYHLSAPVRHTVLGVALAVDYGDAE